MTPDRTLAVALTAVWVAVAGASPIQPASPEWVEPRTGMAFVRVPAGRFMAGSPPGEPHREAQETLHEVTLSRPFWMGRFEVTQEQWHEVMGTRPSWFDGAARGLPVENVSWFEVQAFLRRLTESSRDSRFRLPTEAEWEHACRAGSATAFHTGDRLTAAQANIDPRAPEDASAAQPSGRPVAVGSFPPNAWGLHDMHGNVWEWTEDLHCPYPDGPVTDPRGACDSPLRVIRGGSWRFRSDSARCALRYTHRPQDRGFSLGFRALREVRPGEP
jgi:formylglycine-generating enzyme required for sulfatase activity